ncbi:MAG: hypothetical protein ACK5AV_02290, partial [Alphaproteobacteria bacterium]
VIEEAPKKANIDQIDLSQYKGQTVEQARYQISLLVDVPETHVVAIMHQSAVLLETDAIPAGEPNPVAKIMTEAQYTRGVQSTERLRSSTGQEPEIIYVEPVQPVIEEAPKKANIDQIDLSQYKGQTVEQARYQISLLVDVPQDKTIVFWHQTELLLDTAFLDDISQPKAAFMYIGRYEALTKPKTHNAFKFLDIAGNLVTVNDVNTLDDAITKHFGNNTKVNHYPNKMALHIDNNYSDYRFYMGAYNFYKCEDKVCPVDASFKFESEIQAAIEDQLSTHEERVSVNVDVKNRAYEIEHDPRVTCQVAVEGGNTISKKCKLSDINNIKDELKADRAFSEYHLILDNNAPTELRHRSTLKFQTLRKTECSIFKKADGNIQEIIIENNTPVYTQITKQFFHPFSKDGIGISEIEPIEGNDYTESDFYISNNVIKVQTSNKPITYQYADAKVFENKDTDLLKALGSDIDLNSLVKFSTRDGQITFLIKQNKSGNDEYDMNIIAVRGFGLDTATQLLGEDGLSVRLDERNDHDYRNHKFYRAYSLIKIELSNKNFIYADAEKFRGADNKLKDALKKRLKNQNEVESEIQIDLTWDTNKTTCTASKSIVKPCTASKSIVKNNSTKHMLLSLDSGTTTVILSHLASTYLEVEVHPTAKIILGAAVAYGVYSHLEKQQGPETSL